ncbi:RidA family protein [Smaragdicoccus niigatensis]|uniref:RidA family protein n=1 Tax=Smaragdicoccus niigatensis TaxID=359359 RepID=UPI00037D7A96|nr:RidA family protein [Smaragdicoccus niigatensis]
MSNAERRLSELGFQLPRPAVLPPGVRIPFSWVRVHGSRAFASGHGPLAPDGTMAGPVGQVPSEVSLEQAQSAGVLALLSMLSSLKQAIGSLDRIDAWLTVTGFVNAAPDFELTTMVLNPASELLLEVFGPEVGAHARTAVGYSTLPFRLPVVISAELEIAGATA